MTSFGVLSAGSLLPGARIALQGALVKGLRSTAAQQHACLRLKTSSSLSNSICGELHSSILARSHWSAAGERRNWGVYPSAALGLSASVCGLGFLCGGPELSGMTSALAAAGMLNLAILVHEAGHLAAARALGVAVREFSVGIGPRVAWWQRGTTTYALRALPLFGYVSFFTAAHLAAGAGPGAGGAGMLPAAASASPSGVGVRPLVLLEWLPPGRRAVVMAAGVAANALLAAAFVAWQICMYGEVDVVTRPGVRVAAAAGYQGVQLAAGTEQGQQEQEQELGGERPGPSSSEALLRNGDIILSVAGRDLPAWDDAETAIVDALKGAADARLQSLEAELAAKEVETAARQAEMEAMEAATAAAEPLHAMSSSNYSVGTATSTTTASTATPTGDLVYGREGYGTKGREYGGGSSSGRADGGDDGDDGGDSEARVQRALAGIKMTVLRARAVAPTDAAAVPINTGTNGQREVVYLEASQLLCFETLHLGPNAAVGSRLPADVWQAAEMTGKSLVGWVCDVFRCWSQALRAATTLTAATAAGAAAAAASQDEVPHAQEHPAGPRALPGGTSDGESSARTSPAIASAGTNAGSPAAASGCSSSGCGGGVAAHVGAGGGGGGSEGSGSQLVGPLGMVASAAALASTVNAADPLSNFGQRERELLDESLRMPPLMLQMGIQLNLQLFFVNLLPVPVLDGGQLLLVALEAVRRGRRLPVLVERLALAGSALAVGGWVLALSVRDVVRVLDVAAARLAAAIEPSATANHHQLLRQRPQPAVLATGGGDGDGGAEESDQRVLLGV